jgi:HEAT repeat protein
MNRLLTLVVFGGALAFLIWERKHAQEQEVAPPPPPAIEIPAPKPVFSEAELRKVRRSLEDADAEVRWTAAQVLYNIRDPQAVKLLEHLLANDPDPDLRMKVVRLLRDREDSARLAALVGSLRDTEKSVRIASLQALGDIGDPSVVTWVTALLKDAEPDVRIEALKTIAKFQEKRKAEFDALAAKLKKDYEEAVRRSQQQK